MTGLPARLLLITDRHQAQLAVPRIVAESLDAGARWILFRDRDMPAAERLALGHEVAAAVRVRGGVLSVGGDADLAAELGADGVHVQSAGAVAAARQRLGRPVLVGVSAHSLADVAAAAEAGADYVTLSPIHATPSKPGYGPALGHEALRRGAVLGVPLVALGGIDAGNMSACLAAGAASVAVMGAVMRARRPGEVVAHLLQGSAATAPPTL